MSPTVGAGLLIQSDGLSARTLRKNFRSGDVTLASALDAAQLPQRGFQFQPSTGEAGERKLRPLTDRFEGVLFEVHSALRDIDGLHAPDALDEICKLIYAKIFDEENALKSGFHRFQRHIYSSIEDCSASIRRLYYDAVQDDESVFSNRIPSYSRSRGVFRDPLTLSSAALARSVSLLEEYDFSGSPVDIKGRAFQKVLGAATRSDMGQYFTPKSIISLCVELLAPTARDMIIDPFCGSGHFLTASLDHVRRKGAHSDKQFHEFAFSRLHGLEKSDRMVRVAMTDMRLHGDGHSNIRCTDSLLCFESYPDLYPGSFDVVLTNPPFGVDLPREALAELGPFDVLTGQRSTSGAVSLEVVAIDRCISLLRPGGRMAIVLPDGVLGNRGTAFVRSWIKRKAAIRAIISLPVEAFSPFGANVKTSILIIRKFEAGELIDDDYKVFMTDLKAIGYDAAGRPADCDDFEVLSNSFKSFIEAEGW